MAGLDGAEFRFGRGGNGDRHRLIRGFARQKARRIGNFWVDLTRATLYVLLPLSIVGALFLCSQGVIQNLQPYTAATTVEGAKQTIAQGPVASQEAIKMLGTNGGGFFNANSAHPFENPTPLTNLFQMLLIFVIPAGADLHVRPDGRRHAPGLGDVRRHERPVPGGRVRLLRSEQAGNPILAKLGLQTAATAASRRQHGRQGSALRHRRLRAVRHRHHRRQLRRGEHACTTASRRSAGLVPLFNMQTGEVIFGGVGAGMYGMLLFAIWRSSSPG